jgi:hypothetical protein
MRIEKGKEKQDGKEKWMLVRDKREKYKEGG